MTKINLFEEEELILHIADLHYGEKVESEYNTYNTAIAKKRLDYFFDKALRIARDIYSKAIPIKKVHIFINGDMILNETMRGSQKMVAEMNLIEQVNGVAELLARNIIQFVRRWKAIEVVHIYGVPGNHGRIGKPGDEDQAANYDRQVYDRLELEIELAVATCNDLRDRKFKFHFNRRGELAIAKVAGKWIVMHHSDGVKNQLGIPYYGLARLRDRLYKALKGKMDILLVGHFHRGYMENEGTVKMIMAPSLVGWNEYIGKAGMGHFAGQNIYLVHPTWGITTERTISVGHIKEG